MENTICKKLILLNKKKKTFYCYKIVLTLKEKKCFSLSCLMLALEKQAARHRNLCLEKKFAHERRLRTSCAAQKMLLL